MSPPIIATVSDPVNPARRLVRPGLVLILAAALAGMACATAAVPHSPAPQAVTYPSAGAADDERGSYYVSLLKLALSKADGSFAVMPSREASLNSRVFIRMAAGDGIDVVWAPTTQRLERDFLPVRVALDKGILGWRLFLIRDADRAAFASVHSLAQLKALPAGLVGEWVDTEVLRANGLPVVDAMRYDSLFKMLALQRFRYLPRGMGEIEAEAHRHAPLGLAIEPHLALHYPMCTYFFVARGNTGLAAQIELGLRRAQRDGSFEKLFQQFNGAAIRAAQLDKRLVFELRNPAQPAADAPGQHECREAAAAIRHAK